MVYQLSFTATDKERFALLYQSFVVGGNNAQDKKNIEVLRREIAVMDALDAISAEVDGARMLAAGAQSLTLDTPQYQLVKKYLDVFVSVAATGAARRVVALVDWFDSIKPTELKDSNGPKGTAKKK